MATGGTAATSWVARVVSLSNEKMSPPHVPLGSDAGTNLERKYEQCRDAALKWWEGERLL